MVHWGSRAILLLAVFSGAAEACLSEGLSLTRAEMKIQFLEAVQFSSVNHLDVVQVLGATYPGINHSGIARGLYELESEILEIFAHPDDESHLEAFSQKWGFSADEAFEVLRYYATQVLTGSFLPRLQKQAREEFLNQHRLEYESYKAVLTRLSVPEIAEKFSIPSAEVYRRLCFFQLSIVDAFNRQPTPSEREHFFSLTAARISESDGILTSLRKLETEGSAPEQWVEKAGEAFGFGREALRFVLHHCRLLNRGQPWKRLAHFQGQEVSEVEILTRLRIEGRSVPEITRVLNELFKGEPPRTEEAVTAKLRDLQLTLSHPSQMPDLHHPEYGWLKKGGKLIPAAVFPLIADQFHRGEAWFVQQLGVSSQGFRLFLQRHHIQLVKRPKTRQKLLPASTKADEQARALEQVWKWMAESGRLPTQRDFQDGAFSFSNSKLMGHGPYATGKHQAHSAIFSSAEEFWLALQTHAQAQGQRLRLLDVLFRNPSHALIQVLRDEAHQLVLSWVQGSPDGQPRTPRKKDFGHGPDQIAVDYARLTAVGNYAEGRRLHHARLFSSLQEFWVAQKAYARARNVEIALLQIPFSDGLTPPLKELLREEAVHLILRWRESNREPRCRDFGTQPGQIPIDWHRLTSTGNYAREKKLNASGLFESPEHLAQRLRAESTSCQRLFALN